MLGIVRQTRRSNPRTAQGGALLLAIVGIMLVGGLSFALLTIGTGSTQQAITSHGLFQADALTRSGLAIIEQRLAGLQGMALMNELGVLHNNSITLPELGTVRARCYPQWLQTDALSHQTPPHHAGGCPYPLPNTVLAVHKNGTTQRIPLVSQETPMLLPKEATLLFLAELASCSFTATAQTWSVALSPRTSDALASFPAQHGVIAFVDRLGNIQRPWLSYTRLLREERGIILEGVASLEDTPLDPQTVVGHDLVLGQHLVLVLHAVTQDGSHAESVVSLHVGLSPAPAVRLR